MVCFTVLCLVTIFCCINTHKRIPTHPANPIAADAVDYHTSGMHYKVFITPGGEAIHAINVTKDSLICNKYTYDRHQN